TLVAGPGSRLIAGADQRRAGDDFPGRLYCGTTIWSFSSAVRLDDSACGSAVAPDAVADYVFHVRGRAGADLLSGTECAPQFSVNAARGSAGDWGVVSEFNGAELLPG